MKPNRVFIAACDCVAQFRATRFPLKNVAKDIITSRKLNSRERKVLLNILYSFFRESYLFDKFLTETMLFSSSLSSQKKDVLFLKLLFSEYDLQVNSDTASMKQAFYEWKQSLGESSFLYSLSPLIQQELVADYGKNAIAIAQGLCARPVKYLAFDQSHISSEEILSALQNAHISCFLHPILPTAIGFFDSFDVSILPKTVSEHIWFMDVGSQIIAEIIKPDTDQCVLDMCAGEGNKARYITAKPCSYVAVDMSKKRLDVAKSRLAGKKIKFIVSDASTLSLPENYFDWILLDAPCSGVGTIRRHPDLMHRLSKEDINNYVQIQNKLLTKALSLLKPGGKIVYATCSLFRRENCRQIELLKNKFPDVKSISLRGVLLLDFGVSIGDVNAHDVTLFPHIHNSDGFYVAMLSK